MRFRTRSFALFAMFVALGVIVGTGAFSSVTAPRTVSVNVASDDAALLELQPHNGPNGAYAELSSGELRINFDNVAADGVNQNATTTLGDVFNITNRGTQTVTVDIDETGSYPGLVTFEDGSGTQLDGSASGVSVPVGQTVKVTIVIDTTGQNLSSGTSLLDSITINAQT